MTRFQVPRIAIHWFRRDLRLADNTALAAASRACDVVVPVFVFDPNILRAPDIGAPRVAYLLDCLAELRERLAKAGVPLVVRRGDPVVELVALARDLDANVVFTNRDYSPYGRSRDEKVRTALAREGVGFSDHGDLLLVEPWECVKDDGNPYTVFTPFARRWRGIPKVAPERAVRLRRLGASGDEVRAGALPTLGDLGLESSLQLPAGGESAARQRLRRFVANRLERYASSRDLPALDGTSNLSADLKFGTISARQVLASVGESIGPELLDRDPRRPGPGMTRAEETRLTEMGPFVTELCWRDFYQAVLFHFPRVLRGPFRRTHVALEWPPADPVLLRAWQEGRTGFPIIDAGMRQLRATGWMHNRLRMLTATFLAKTLLIDWRIGERFFMRHLVDGDHAANNGGWQWCASTGTDAAPYFRIFNPWLQSRKIDAEGEYIRRWVPELSDVPAPLVHEPGRDPDILARTGYPPPCIDYAEQRAAALALLGPGGRGRPASV